MVEPCEDQLKAEIEQFTRYGYQGVFLTKQWGLLVRMIGDEAATVWYKTLDYAEDI